MMAGGPSSACRNELEALYPSGANPFDRLIISEGVPVGRLEFSFSSGFVHLNLLSIDPPFEGQGHAREALRRICEAADRHEWECSLVAFFDPRKPDGGRLIRIYTQNGFEVSGEPDEDNRVQMVRRPQPSADPQP